MDKINWKQKLSSRKFWAALIGFITSILYAFNVAESDVAQIAGIITAGSTLVIYILTEGYVDANRDIDNGTTGNVFQTFYPESLLKEDTNLQDANIEDSPPADALD